MTHLYVECCVLSRLALLSLSHVLDVHLHVHILIDVHIHIDVHVGVFFFCLFSLKKRQSRTLDFHDVCFSKPWTFHNGFTFFTLAAVSSNFLDFKPYLNCA